MVVLTPPVSEPRSSRHIPISDASSRNGWRTLIWIGIAFVVMGGTDIALAWRPTFLGNAEWEFGAISATLNGLALPMLGAYLVLSGALARNSRITSRVVGTTMLVFAVALLVLAFLYTTVVPQALKAVAGSGPLRAGMLKAVIKASVLFVAYTALLVAGGIAGWRVRVRG